MDKTEEKDRTVTPETPTVVARGATRLLRGRIKVTPAGYGFVVPEDGSEDVHVSARRRGAAMDADTVEVESWPGVRGIEGRVVSVLQRGRAKITGQIVMGTLGGFPTPPAMGSGGQSPPAPHAIAPGARQLQPDDPRIHGMVTLPEGAAGARPGQAVVAEITRYPEAPDAPLEAAVLKVLGDPDDPRTEVEKVLACAGIEDEFPAPVLAEAKAVPSDVRDADRADRVDLRHVPFMTIDPETARDFDDAVAVEAQPHGRTRLWVAVADVSHYLREGTALDAEARRRGCSIYLPNRAIPMLPEQLSAHMCSLVPEQDRLAMVVRIDFDRRGLPVEHAVAAAVIHSRARLDYPGVAAALAGDTRGKRKRYEPLIPTLREMDALARRLRATRMARGAMDLDLPEVVVQLDQDDPRLVRDVRRARKDPGERQAYAMIEEFMLAANEAVARSFPEHGEDAVWRVHAPPELSRVEEFATLAANYGIQVDVEEARTPKGLRKVLERLHGHPAEKPLSFLLLRTLKQATYDVSNVGHFGLAAPDYVHFTSPIRRYPDVIIHRLVKHRLAAAGRSAGSWTGERPTRAALQIMAADSSFSERQAMEVEREVTDLYRAFFMRDRIGDVLEGRISGVAGFGLFVTVDEPFVEGLVRIETLADDYYLHDEQASALVGRRSGRRFALGDAVTVEVETVSVVRRKIDLVLHRHEERPRQRVQRVKNRRGKKGKGRPESQRKRDRSGARPGARPRKKGRRP